MDLEALIKRALASRSPTEPLYTTAAWVWFEASDQLDSTDRQAMGVMGLDAIFVTGGVPDQFKATISVATLDAAIAGTAEWPRLPPSDQEACALLGFLTVVADTILTGQEGAHHPLLN